MNNQKKLHKTISDVLGIPESSIDEKSSQDNIEKWDSLSHLNLVMAIESEFEVQLSPEDSMDMLSVKLIRIILEDALIK